MSSIEIPQNKINIKELISSEDVSFESIMNGIDRCDLHRPLDLEGRKLFMEAINRFKPTREEISKLRRKIMQLIDPLFTPPNIPRIHGEWSALFSSLGKYEQHTFDGVDFVVPID